jgi:flagellar biosynthesis GTPase FlhF
MGGANVSLAMAPNPPTVILMAGLQGSGKTTCTAKLARHLLNEGRAPLMVACDVHRPAAMDQLAVLGEQIGVPVHLEKGSTDPVKIAKDGIAAAKRSGRDVVIVDTAGRLTIDEEMMAELVAIRDTVKPTSVVLVVDAMTGQTAVEVATAFQEAVQFDGVVLSKLDGDARGGAALSVRSVTGKPILFVGTGEKVLVSCIIMASNRRMVGFFLKQGLCGVQATVFWNTTWCGITKGSNSAWICASTFAWSGVLTLSRVTVINCPCTSCAATVTVNEAPAGTRLASRSLTMRCAASSAL